MSFASIIDDFAQETEKDIQEFVEGKAKILFVKIVQRTPVDTGLFRANWQLSYNSPASGVLSSTDKMGAQTISDIMSKLKQWNKEDDIFLTNNQPHALPCEYGHSNQAPAGMVRISMAEMES